MNSDNLISIILPTYNRASLLLRAVQSVIDQTYPHWELIIWDDGSTDDTAVVVKAFNDNRIRYYHDANHGAAYARNRAIAQANGEIIAFLDSDDVWHPEKLGIQVTVLEQCPEIEMIFSNFFNRNLVSNLERAAFDENCSALNLLRTRPLEGHIHLITGGFLDALASENMIATDTVCLRRLVVERSGGFNETLRNSEDFELWWRLGLAGVSMAYDTRLLLTRNKPSDSLSSHSVPTHVNRIKALGSCTKQALAVGQPAAARSLRKQYRNAWQLMILESGKTGDRMGALKAFFRTLRYGFSPGSVRLLFRALIGRKQQNG